MLDLFANVRESLKDKIKVQDEEGVKRVLPGSAWSYREITTKRQQSQETSNSISSPTKESIVAF